MQGGVVGDAGGEHLRLHLKRREAGPKGWDGAGGAGEGGPEGRWEVMLKPIRG